MNAALLRLPESLRHHYEAVRSLLSDASVNETLARYSVGTIILSVRNATDKYGRNAVSQLAAALGRDETTLYRYASVAEAWSESELHALVERRDKHGQPLSWSHLLILSRVSDREQRGGLLERALCDASTVRELSRLSRRAEQRAKLSAALPRSLPDAAAPSDAPPDGYLTEVSRSLARIVQVSRQLRDSAEHCRRTLLNGSSDAVAEQQIAALIDEALAAQHELRVSAQRTLADLRSRLRAPQAPVVSLGASPHAACVLPG